MTDFSDDQSSAIRAAAEEGIAAFDEALAAAPSQTIEISGAAGDVIELPLGQGPATGYSWTLELPDGVEQLPDGPPLEPAGGPPIVGADTSGRFRIRVAAPGSYTIAASYARPWEGAIVDTKTFLVTVV